MQRKALCTLLLYTCFAVQVFSQSLPYQFSTWVGNYQALSGATVLPASAWQEDFVDVNLGFDFQFANATQTSFELSPFEGSLFKNYGLSGAGNAQAILGYNTWGLRNVPGAQVRYKTEGLAPFRVFKAEWFKVGFEDEPGTVSFQIWLYETTNVIQIHLGDQQVPNPDAVFYNGISPMIGVLVDLNLLPNDQLVFGYAHFVEGNPTAPTDTVLVDWLMPADFDAPPFGCEDVPQNGLVFTFTPQDVTGTRSVATEKLTFFPNPASDQIILNETLSLSKRIQLIDLQGRIVQETELGAGENVLRLAPDLTPGMYCLRCISGDRISVGQVIIKKS